MFENVRKWILAPKKRGGLHFHTLVEFLGGEMPPATSAPSFFPGKPLSLFGEETDLPE